MPRPDDERLGELGEQYAGVDGAVGMPGDQQPAAVGWEVLEPSHLDAAKEDS